MQYSFLHAKYIRCQSPKYENGFQHWRHLASGQAMNTNDENLSVRMLKISSKLLDLLEKKH